MTILQLWQRLILVNKGQITHCTASQTMINYILRMSFMVTHSHVKTDLDFMSLHRVVPGKNTLKATAVQTVITLIITFKAS